LPEIATLHNGLGASLLERSLVEPNAEAVVTLQEALEAFQAARSLAMHQAVPHATRLRYEINLAMALWMLAERTHDAGRAEDAVTSLRALSSDLPRSSAYWSHVQDNLGSALMVLGRTDEAVTAYLGALGVRQGSAERARTLNNLGTAYADQGNYADAQGSYHDSLLLQPRQDMPLAWARIQHNLATALLQEALSNAQPQLVGRQLHEAVERFETALQERTQRNSVSDWAVTTANLAGACLALGTHLLTRQSQPDHRSAVAHIRRAIELYQAVLADLTTADMTKALQNITVALQILATAPENGPTEADLRGHRVNVLSVAMQRGLQDVTERLGTGVEYPKRSVLVPGARAGGAEHAADPKWPSETYSQASKERKEDIVQFLTRVWLPLIQVGMVDLRTLRKTDPSAAKAVDNYTQRKDPMTGERRKLPPHLHLPTKKELNDRLAEIIPDPGDRPVRLDWALRSRARRAVLRK
jgi:tetratricopeptide (TPR) repeat protein